MEICNAYGSFIQTTPPLIYSPDVITKQEHYKQTKFSNFSVNKFSLLLLLNV